jgi:hypothetical protein
MKHRHVFSTADLGTATAAIAAARRAGAADKDISLIARSDIEIEKIPQDRLDIAADTVPAAWRGAVTGGSAGFVAGLVALAIPPLGVTVAGIAALAALGAAVGTWSSAMMGSTVPNSVRRKFEAEIEAGRILVVVDVDKQDLPLLDATVAAAGAIPLPFDEPTAIA